MKKRMLTLIITFIIWLIFAGRISLPILLLGLGICAIVSLMFAEKVFQFLKVDYGLHIFLKKLFYIFLVLGAFIYDVFVSAIKVSRHAFELNPSFSPGIVKIKTSLSSVTGITILANLITLTPGTLVMDFDILNKNYYIHWIDVRTEDEAEMKKEIIGKQESWIQNIFE